MHLATLLHCRALRQILFFALCCSLIVYVLLTLTANSSSMSTNVDERNRASPIQTRVNGGGSGQQRHGSTRHCRLFAQPVGSSARLGNRMFVHAAMLGLARTAGCRPAAYAPDNVLLRSVFELSSSEVVENRKPRNIRPLIYPWRTAVYVPFNVSDDDVIADGEDVQVD